MSRAASLPGPDLFPEISFFLEEATCPGQLRCLGQFFFPEMSFFCLEETTCPGQLRCMGQFFSPEICFFWKKPLVWGSFAAWGRTFSQKSDFLNKPLVWGSCAAWGRTCSQKSDPFLSTRNLSRAASLPGAELFFQKIDIFFSYAICPVPPLSLGQNFSRKSIFFEEATCPGTLRCLGQNFCLKSFFFC